MAELAKKQATLKTWLMDDALRRHVATVLPRHLKAERVLAIARQAATRTPKLNECTIDSVIACIVTASRLGLEIDGPAGGAHPVPFKNHKSGRLECQLVPDYRGLQRLARQSKQLASIEAHVVYECDEFSYQFGTDPKIHHVPRDWPGGQEPPITHVYATTTYTGGQKQFEVLTKSEVDKVRASAASSNSPAWVQWYGEMAKKTAFKRLAKWLPSSVELMTAVTIDDQYEMGIPQDLDIITVTTPEPEPEPAPQLPKAAEPKVKLDAYKAIHEAAMALPTDARATVLGQFGCNLVTDAKKMDAETANDLLVALKDAANVPA